MKALHQTTAANVGVSFTPTPDVEAPSVLAGVVGAAASPWQVNLSWAPSPDNVETTSYTVYRDGIAVASVTSGVTLSDTGLTPGTTYSYTVAARDAAGNSSAQSAPAVVTTPAVTTRTFTAVADAYVNQDSPTVNYNRGANLTKLRFDGSPIVSSYVRFQLQGLSGMVVRATLRIYAATGSGAGYDVRTVGGAWDEATITYNNAPPAGTAVLAASPSFPAGGYSEADVTSLVGGAGTLDWALTRQATSAVTGSSRETATPPELVVQTTTGTIDTQAPSAPTGLTAVAGATQVRLSWDAASDNVGVTGYTLYRDGLRIAVVGNATNYADTGLQPGATLGYTVVAGDAANNQSPHSAPAHATTVDMQAPTTPTGLTATAVTPTRIDLEWNPASDDVAVGGYTVYRDGVAVATVADGTSFSDAGLSPATTYGYAVDAFDAAGNSSDRSSALTAQTPAPPDTEAPSVPTGLIAIASNSSTVDLTWNPSADNVGVAGYVVYRDGTQVATVTVGTSYSDTGLSPGTTYSYTVEAFDAAENISAQSEAASATPVDAEPPSVPSELVATAVSATRVDLFWAASTDDVGVAGYTVYRDGTAVSIVVDGTSYSDRGLTPETAYSYTVDVFDAAGNVSVQTGASAATTLADTSAPSVPSSLVAQAVSGTRVDLSWAASSDDVGVARYTVYRDGIAVGLTDGTTFSDTGLSPGTTYEYTLDAHDAAGNVSAESSSVQATTPDTQAPTVPGGLVASAESPTRVDLSWSASSDNVGVAGYTVFRNDVEIATVTGATSFSDTGLSPATSYRYTVAAFDAAGNVSARAEGVPTTTPADTHGPSVPADVSASALSQSVIHVRWQAASDDVAVAGYRVYRNGELAGTVTSGTDFADAGLRAATAYAYAVAAFDVAGNISALSETASATTPDTAAPSVPAGVSGSAISPTSVHLSWSASSDNVAVAGYRVFRDGALVATVTGGTSFTDTGAKPATTYSYSVAAFDAAGNVSAGSQEAGVTTPRLSLSFPSVADAYVRSESPSATGGTATTLRLDASPVTRTYLRFNVQGLPGPVARATLRLVAATAGAGYEVHGEVASNSWDEGSLIYQNAPSFAAAVAGTAPAFQAGQQTTVDVTPLVTGTGPVSFVVTTLSSTQMNLHAREAGGANVPTLVVETGAPDTQAPSVPTGVAASAPSPGQVQLTWVAASDDVGVAGYRIYRDGAEVAIVTSATSFADSGLQAGTTYVYTVRSFDAAGNTSAHSAGAQTTTQLPPTSTTFAAVADAYTDADHPSQNYGLNAKLRVDTSPSVRSYLRFDLSGLSGTVRRARLRLYATSSLTAGYEVRSVADTNWGELTITTGNQPPIGSSPVGVSGPVSQNNWTEVDVTSLVTGNGPVSLALIGLDSTALAFSSRDSTANRPQLVVDTT